MIDLDVIDRATPISVAAIQGFADGCGGAAQIGHGDAGVCLVSDKFAVTKHGEGFAVDDQLVVVPDIVIVRQRSLKSLLIVPLVIGNDELRGLGAQVPEQVFLLASTHREAEIVAVISMT